MCRYSEMGVYKGTITGKLISRQTGVGTLSEGPLYFIIPTDKYKMWDEIIIRKTVMLWMKDPVLDGLVGENISITGEITETKDTITMDYTEVNHNGKIIPAINNHEKKII